MATSQVPVLIDALVAQAPAATGLPASAVYDGFPISRDPGDFLAIGVEDPGDPGRASAAMTQQDYAHAAGTRRDEVGAIRCAVSTTSGDGVMKTARDAAYAVTAGLETLCRTGANPVGLPTIWSLGVTDTVLYEDQTDDGAFVLLVFSIAFKARI